MPSFIPAKPFSAVFAVLFASAAFAADVAVDARYDRRSINPDIYGLILGDDAQIARMGVTVRRHGGNTFSRFNWKTSTSNTGGDGFFFQSTPMSPVDAWVNVNKGAKVQSMVELPSIGFINQAMSPAAKCSFKVSKYGAQQATSPSDPDCGNGVKTDGQMVVGNDPLDTSMATPATWSSEWVTHLVQTFGTAANGGVRFYNLSNQPALWHETHRDVHPQRSTYEEVKETLYKNGAAVKAADPSAQTLGPAAWGWLEYFDSASYEREKLGVDFLPYYLKQAKAYEDANQQRILDYLDIHVYPQQPGVAAVDAGTAGPDNAARLASTRILWDPSYTVESWESCCYGGVMKVIPRMKAWIAENYPGTRLAISGYSWGFIDEPSGALAQTDVLGIFGREGVDLATLENPPGPNGLGEDAFKLYRNYDGAGSTFGNTAIRARSNDGLLASFSAFENGKVTTVLINKNPAAVAQANVGFTGMGTSGPYRSFQFGQGGRLAPAGSGNVNDGTLSMSLPPYSATLVEFVPQGGIGGEEVEPITPDGGTPGPGVTPNPAGGCSCSQVDVGVIGLAALLGMLKRRGRKQE